MKIAIFFVYLLSFLLSGNTNAYTGKHDDSFGQNQKLQIKDNTAVYLTLSGNENVTVDRTEPSVEKQYLINDEIEDEDICNNGLTEKSKLPGKCHSLTYTGTTPPSVLNYLCNYFNAPPCFLGQAEHKYILQSVFRI